jgi:hypothetical protein
MPQMWLRPFMARTMVEDGHRVKPPPGTVAERARPSAKRTEACGKRALERPEHCELQEVNETSTPPSHSYDQL